jgi:hypothetical protein
MHVATMGRESQTARMERMERVTEHQAAVLEDPMRRAASQVRIIDVSLPEEVGIKAALLSAVRSMPRCQS